MDKRFPIEDQISMFSSAIKGRVVTPVDADYDAVRMVVLANFDCRPRAVIRVANATDVTAVLNFAQATDLEIAIRSGGHSVGGFSGTDGGIVIDLRDLNGMAIDAEAKTAWCGAGLTAGDVTRAVEQHGLIVGFGDSASVGIGGLTLGGGIGYMVRKHGLTIDSLLAVEIVTAAGDIIVADATHHAELFWALRGGGGNFGVVTRFKYRLHDLPSFVGGPLILPAQPEVLAGFMAASAAAPEELSAIAFVMPCPPMPFLPPAMHGQVVIIAMMAYAGDPAAAQAALAPFRALATPIVDLVRPAPYSSLYIMEPPPGLRDAVSCRSRFSNRLGVEEAATIIDRIQRSDAPMRMAQVRTLGGAFSRVGNGDTAFGHRNATVMTAFLAMYGSVADQPHHDAWATEAMNAVAPGETGVYVNFLAQEGEARLHAAYPAGTWERLRQVKRRYDPENLFRLNQNIRPAS